MTTITVTETMQRPVLSLRLKMPEETPLSFLEKMSRAPFFSEQEYLLIGDLIENFEEQDAPGFLTLFLSQVVYPRFEREETEQNLEELLNIEDELKRLLERILPEETDIDLFLEEAIRQSDLDLEVSKVTQTASRIFDEKEDLLYQGGDTINQEIEEGHERLKGRLIRLIQLMEQMSERGQTQMDNIDQITNALSAISGEFQKLCDRRQEGLIEYQQLLGRCNELLRKK